MKNLDTKTTFSAKIIKALAAIFILLQLAACNHDAIVAVDGNSNNTASSTSSGNNSTGTISAARLSWIAPAARADSSPLSMSEIAGYRIYYRTSEGNYAPYADINDAYTTQIEIDASQLPANAEAVVMTTIDVAGRESAYSAEVLLDA